MKTPIKRINPITEEEKLELLMKTIKAVHSSAANHSFDSPESLAHQRAETERFSRLVSINSNTHITPFQVGNIPCEWIRPDFPHRKDCIILYCHGGGYTNGGLGYARVLGTKLATRSGYEVVNFEYRLAPEHPYPAAIEDACMVYDFLLHKGYGASSIILTGDSAGGNLALELCFTLKSAERFLPKALVLMSPWTDMRAISSSYKTCKDCDPLLTYEYIIAARTAYAGVDADFEQPCYSPLLGDFTNFPPTLIQVGSCELLRRDSEKLAKEMSSAGVSATLEVYKGLWHVFQQMPIAKATQALDSVATFLQKLP